VRRVIGEIDIYGVSVAPLLVWMVIAWMAARILRQVFVSIGIYRLVWHPALFDLAMFVLVLNRVTTCSRASIPRSPGFGLRNVSSARQAGQRPGQPEHPARPDGHGRGQQPATLNRLLSGEPSIALERLS
jgi:protein AaeX